MRKFGCLKELFACDNDISELKPLENCRFLKYADLSANHISDPTPAFASEMLSKINLSHNEISDFELLKKFSGAYYNKDIFEYEITVDVRYNCMTTLTESDVSAILKQYRSGNMLVPNIDINFYYSEQSESTLNPIPMRSYSIQDAVVTREALCRSKLSTVLGFTPYPSDANTGNNLVWSCSEEGYFDSEGNILVKPEQITSCRTLTVTATVPSGSSAKSVVTGTASQSVTLTINAPEIYSAYLTQNACLPNTLVYFTVVTNPYVSKLVLATDALGEHKIISTYSSMSSAPLLASNGSRAKTFVLPSSVTSTTGEHHLYLYALDSEDNFATIKTQDICTLAPTFGFKELGTLKVSESIPDATALEVRGTEFVNRYGEAASFAVCIPGTNVLYCMSLKETEYGLPEWRNWQTPGT